MIARIALLSLVSLTAGCAPQKPQTAPIPAVVECDANRVLYLKGRPRNAIDESEALRHSGAKRLRWIEPGSAVTMDFRVDRLNLHVDKAGTITDARCG
ncbi:I78 family peptidase inhibitor [Sphingomonas sp. R1]|uniref:I78 family peptidase inhibitor n=1 Tax=Sphingomonas sp. R1 TaxID=399176 RepID=UPI0022252084|nr:I78 family peptidase inhibitor [Sphingomonas sp. R1]UYY78014.1 I78 family peptidase inhibitor [Sphingomonas sp. R1]